MPDTNNEVAPGPALGDTVNLSDLVGIMAASLLQALSTRLAMEWQKQNPGVTLHGAAYQPLTLEVNYKLLQSIASELARNTAQAIYDIPLNVKAILEAA
jgi:hypothetical protein